MSAHVKAVYPDRGLTADAFKFEINMLVVDVGGQVERLAVPADAALVAALVEQTPGNGIGLDRPIMRQRDRAPGFIIKVETGIAAGKPGLDRIGSRFWRQAMIARPEFPSAIEQYSLHSSSWVLRWTPLG